MTHKTEVPSKDVEKLWQDYCEAARAAQASLKIKDGIIAGHAWAAFMAAFLPSKVAA